MQSLTCACLCLYCSFASFFVNLQLFFSLSKPDSLFLSLLIHGFWFLRSWVQAISRLLIHGFMSLIFLVSGCWWFFWVHGLDYLLKKSIKEKKILIILIFWASFHLLFCRTWRTVLDSPALFWVCICFGFALDSGFYFLFF